MNVLNSANYKIIFRPDDLPLNLSGRNELEIGFGNGEYTVSYAKAHPEITLYGFEMSYSCVLKCARRAGGVKNLRIFRADAQIMLREIFDDNSLDKIYMNFPCPWPKRRHAQKRVISGHFADNLACVLKLNGIFELVTDDKDYADETRENFIQHEALDLKNFEINPERPVTTKYERKWLAEGKDIYRLIFEKTCEPDVKIKNKNKNKNENEDNEEFKIMQFEAERPVTEDFLKKLNGVSGHDDDGAYWSFGRYFKDESADAFLLESFAVDDEFKQRYYVKIYNKVNKNSEKFISIQLDNTASAFMTPAVKKSLRDIYERCAADVGACASGVI